MNVGQLRRILEDLPDDMPVVMSQGDEPMGDYEVLSADVVNMQPSRYFPGVNPTVWDDDLPRGEIGVPCLFLGDEGPPRRIIDGELAPKAIEEQPNGRQRRGGTE